MTLTTYPTDVLAQYAYRNIWCAPAQDNQIVICPSRMTPDQGVWNTFETDWKQYNLPTKNERYHLYHVGQVFPHLLGLINQQRTWFSTRFLSEELNAYCSVYTEKGYLIPGNKAFYMVTSDRLLVLAIKIPDHRKIPVDLVTEKVYLRVYRNAIFYTPESNNQGLAIRHVVKDSISNADILGMQNTIVGLSSQSGAVLSYVNGQLVKGISLLTAVPGDSISYIYDPTIKQQLTFKVDQLHEFLSTLDAENKYLIHNEFGTTAVDYCDDIDIYVLNGPVSSQFKGLYYHRNTIERLRSVTHRDYSVTSQGVSDLYQAFKTPINHHEAYVHLVIREAATNRVAVDEANRIKDLYRLDDEDVYRALVGIDATVPVWNAANLEASQLNKLRRAQYGSITRENAFEALGYNAASKIIGDSPLKVINESGQKYVAVPLGLQDSCTAYEYDSSGKLLGWYLVHNSATYNVANSQTELVELLAGEAATAFDEVRDQQTSVLIPKHNYRFYLCGRQFGMPMNNWRDVSGTANYHAFANGNVSWSIDPQLDYNLIRSNKKHVTYRLTHSFDDGNIMFNVSQWDAASQQWVIMRIPPARLDIFLNEHSLIEGVDYRVKWPGVYLTSKEYLINNGLGDQEIIIRAYGFCDGELNRLEPGDVGFVKHGALSENNTYNIREDKVNRIIIGGGVYHYSDLRFAESDSTPRVLDALNGKPYLISDLLVPMDNFIGSTTSDIDPTLTAREQARQLDKVISDYLTLKLPERVIETPSTFIRRYRLFSPFFTKLMAAVRTGQISGEWMLNHYGEQKVREACLPFEYLLEWDPVTEDNEVDPTFAEVHPHPFAMVIELSPYEYKFLNMAIKVYGRSKINLSTHAVITQN